MSDATDTDSTWNAEDVHGLAVAMKDLTERMGDLGRRVAAIEAHISPASCAHPPDPVRLAGTTKSGEDIDLRAVYIFRPAGTAGALSPGALSAARKPAATLEDFGFFAPLRFDLLRERFAADGEEALLISEETETDR